MNATPQTIQVERELAHHIRWTIAKLVPDVFGEALERLRVELDEPIYLNSVCRS